jgi:monoamine oxidase
MVTVTTRQGATFTSNYVVMAIPPVMAGQIAYSPPLSQEKMTLLSNLRPMGDETKFVATYQSAFWRQANLTGNTQFRASEAADGAMSLINDVVTFDTTTAFGRPALVGYYVLSREDESDMNRQEAVLNIVATLFGNDAARHPIAYKEQRWNSDVPFSKGGAGTLGVSSTYLGGKYYVIGSRIRVVRCSLLRSVFL